MARIPDEELQRIKSQVKVEDLCREYGIELKRMGPDNLMGKCPFHDDHTPSFGVTPSKNLWNCLAGCGGGDTIQLVMKKESVSFRHAVEVLRQRLGIAPQAAPTLTTRMGTTHPVLVPPSEGFKAGDQNLYRYVDNSPLDKTDPTGMDAQSDASSLQTDDSGKPDDSEGNSNTTPSDNTSTNGSDNAGTTAASDGRDQTDQKGATPDGAQTNGRTRSIGPAEAELASKYPDLAQKWRDAMKLQAMGIDPRVALTRQDLIELSLYGQADYRPWRAREAWLPWTTRRLRWMF